MRTAIRHTPVFKNTQEADLLTMSFKLNGLGGCIFTIPGLIFLLALGFCASATAGTFGCKECLIDSKVTSAEWGKSGYVICPDGHPPKVYLEASSFFYYYGEIGGQFGEEFSYGTYVANPLLATPPNYPPSCRLWDNASATSSNWWTLVGPDGCISHNTLYGSDDPGCASSATSFLDQWTFHHLPTEGTSTSSYVCNTNTSIGTFHYEYSTESVNIVMTTTNLWTGSTEFTDGMLRGIIIGKMPAYPSEWTPGSGSAAYSFCDTNHVVGNGQKALYRFKIPDSRTNETYRIKWKEVTRYEDGGKEEVKKLSEEIRGTGEPTNYAYGSEHELQMPVRAGVTTVESVRVYIVPSPAPPAGSGGGGGGFGSGGGGHGSFTGGCGNCSSGGVGHEADEDEDEDDASFAVSMGGMADGGSAGSISFNHSLPTAQMYSPASLQFSGGGSGVDVVTNSDGSIRQIFAPQALAVVVSNSPSSYQILFYYTNSVGPKTGGFYLTNGATPYASWTISNPNTSTTNQLQISETRDGDVVNQWNYVAASTNGNWTVSPLGGQIMTSTSSTNWVDGSGNHFRQVTTTRSNLLGVISSREKTTYQQFDYWGEAVVTNAVGSDADPEITVYTYYSSASYVGGTVVPLKSVTHPDGSWEYYEQNDAQGRPTTVYSSYLDKTIDERSSARQTDYYYGNGSVYGSTDDGTIDPDSPRCVVEYAGGYEISRRYTVYRSTGETLEVQCTTVPNAPWDDPSNLVTTNRYYTNGANLYRLSGVYRPDGTATLFAYAVNAAGTVYTNIVISGALNSSGAVTNGTRSVSIADAYGNAISRTTFNVATNSSADGMTIDAQTYGNIDGFGRPQSVTHLDGTTEWTLYSPCCGVISSSTNREGVATTYIYDLAKRNLGYVRNGVTYTNLLDASGRVLESIRVASSGSITNMKAGFDLAGHLVAQTNALGGPTSIVETQDGTTGGLIRTTTNPDTGTRIEAYYLDGSLKSVTGTAVQPMAYGYDTEDLGGVRCTVTIQTNLSTGGLPTDEWVKTYTDPAGRSVRTVYSGATGVSESFYNAKGQLDRQVDADTNTVWFEYNSNGELTTTIMDVDQDGTKETSGPDRVTRSASDYTTLSGGSWNGVSVRRSRTWQRNDANQEVLASESWVSTNGLRSASISFGVTNQAVTEYLGSSQRRQTRTAPDGTTTVSVYTNGLLQSVTRKDTLNNPLSAVTYSYDSHLRVSQSIDARNGATTLGYNAADLVTSSAAQNLATYTYYDSSLRAYLVQQPDGGNVTNEFYLTGQLKKTTGARTYPVEYTYDYAGRMQTMKTWTNYPNGTAVTTWLYDGNRGWLAGKFYANATTGEAQTNSGVTYTYTDAGRLLSRTWTRGITTTYGYNGAGDLTAADYSDSTPDAGYGYDRRGRQTTVTNGGSLMLARAFNDAGQMTGESYTSGPLSGIRVTNEFDGLLRRTNFAVLSGSTRLTTNMYSYNATSGRLDTVSDGLGDTATYSYVANSTLVSDIVFKQGSTTRMTTSKSYDLLNRVTSVQNTGAGIPAVSFGYQNNAANQRTRNTFADGSYWDYKYDVLGQVTNAVKYWSDNTVVAGQQFGYAFDDIGNRKQTKAGGDATGANQRGANYTANLLNQYTSRTVPGTNDVIGAAMITNAVTVNGQTSYRRGEYFWKEVSTNNSSAPGWLGITVSSGGSNIAGSVLLPKASESFTYDPDGNLTSDSLWTNVWNGENRRTTVESSAAVPTAGKAREVWSYLPDGRWIERIVSTNNGSSYVTVSTNRFVWDGNVLAAVLNGGNGLSQAFMRGLDLSGTLQGAGGVGGLLAVLDQSTINNQPSAHFVASDANGNVVLLVNAADGKESARYEYGPFAEPLRATGVMGKANPIRFSTQFADDVTGDLKYLYRDLTQFGRLPSKDPIGELGFETLWRGRASLRGDGPNLYLFVRNAPVSFIDAFGLTRVESGTWFPGSISDGVVHWTDVDDGQSGTVTLKRITMAEVEAEMRDLVNQLDGFRKRDGCKSRKYEGGFDSKYFAGENQQHQYYLVDGQGPLYADNQINYIGIGLYEAWFCDSLTKAKAIVWYWKLARWWDTPSAGTMHWLEVGYNKYQTLKSADDTCCRCGHDTPSDRRDDAREPWR